MAECKGLDVVGFNAKDVVSYGGLRTKVREVFARTKAFVDILFGVKPKFLGDKITIQKFLFFYQQQEYFRSIKTVILYFNSLET